MVQVPINADAAESFINSKIDTISD